MTSMAEIIVTKIKDKVPLGTLLILDELIIPQDLDFALDHQKHSNQLIGQILIHIGALNHDELENALQLQSKNGRSPGGRNSPPPVIP